MNAVTFVRFTSKEGHFSALGSTFFLTVIISSFSVRIKPPTLSKSFGIHEYLLKSTSRYRLLGSMLIFRKP
ncbi:MAG: hypothetical protein QXU63_07030, partial [Nitrososphaerota archaeon]